MGNEDGGGRTKRFAAYLAELASVLGDARRHAAMISYCTGLLSPSERKSVEPMAALTAPTRTAAQHQSLLHFVGQGEWSDEAVMERDPCLLDAADREARRHFGVDRRRHCVSQKGQALGRRRTAILRTTRQAGQLSGSSLALARQQCREFTGGVSTVPAAIMGERRRAAGESGCAEGRGIQDKTTDRAGTNQMGL